MNIVERRGSQKQQETTSWIWRYDVGNYNENQAGHCMLDAPGNVYVVVDSHCVFSVVCCGTEVVGCRWRKLERGRGGFFDQSTYRN